MNKANGLSHGPGVARSPVLAKCPACESVISMSEYERILRITEARQKQQADERAALARERELLQRERAAVAEHAAAKEVWAAAQARLKGRG